MPSDKSMQLAREIITPPICNGSHMDEVHHEIYEKNVAEAAALIDAAIAEATDELRTQLAERDAQLEALNEAIRLRPMNELIGTGELGLVIYNVRSQDFRHTHARTACINAVDENRPIHGWIEPKAFFKAVLANQNGSK